jgi:hypothetical protein
VQRAVCALTHIIFAGACRIIVPTASGGGDLIARLNAPESRSRIAGDGAELVASSPEEFVAFIAAETVKWAKVAKAAGIQPE